MILSGDTSGDFGGPRSSGPDLRIGTGGPAGDLMGDTRGTKITPLRGETPTSSLRSDRRSAWRPALARLRDDTRRQRQTIKNSQPGPT